MVDAAKGPWTCFHCGETFTSESCARLHFGDDEESKVACLIKAGAEGSILRALRDAERETRRAWGIVHREVGDVHRAYYAAQCRHSQALISAEELGYERGLRDSHRTEATAELVEALKAAEAAIARVTEGDGGMSPATPWRADGKASKNDRCPHGRWMYEGCETCACAVLDPVIDDIIRPALAKHLTDGPGLTERGEN